MNKKFNVIVNYNKSVENLYNTCFNYDYFITNNRYISEITKTN